ncbi:MAG: ATP-binding cassette domain-containing protein [Sulfolobales archaeon]|nr:ATP-binding cassette domain-containing protein [Sulfolobales archaeon]MDW8083496.1 ATP-binding cassette domain-containing protein [Sulfolobales archaeon]
MFFPSRQSFLRVVDVTKRFPGVLALDSVTLELYLSEIHSILGENGSGKSTLAKVIAGIYVPDRGYIEILGKPMKLLSPVDAVNYGIYYIPQNPNLVERLTVVENILIALKSYSAFARVSEVRSLIVEESQKIGSLIDPEAEVSELSYTQRQIVELVKASLLRARVLLVDEVTTYLPTSVREKFYSYLRKLKSENKIVLLITHKVSEAVDVADRITVMRSGRIVKTIEKAEFDVDYVRKLMFGENGYISEPPKNVLLKDLTTENRRAVVKLDRVWVISESRGYALKDIELSVKPGEILGVVGISGSGQRELAEVLVGLRSIRSGRYYVDGLDVTNRGPEAIRAAGIGFISETPLYHNLSGDLSLVENLALATYGKLFLPLKLLTAKTRELMEKYGIISTSPKTPVKVLSGGNIMRFTIARELEFAKKALIVLNPSRSLDEKFKWSFINTIKNISRSTDMSVIYISESLDEVLQVSDTVAVINGGRIVGVFSRESVEREVLEKLMVM